MTFTSLAFAYLTIQVMLAITAFVALLASLIRGSYRSLLKIQYQALGIVIIASLSYPFWPKQKIFDPMLKVWAAPSLRASTHAPLNLPSLGHLTLRNPKYSLGEKTNFITYFLIFLAVTLLYVGFWRFARELFMLKKLRHGSYSIRRLGRVQISLHDQVSVPLSYHTLRFAHVILPTKLLDNRIQFRIAIAHELQHHRQHDTIYLFVLAFLRHFFGLNPLLHRWTQTILELQEFACDEALLGQRRVAPQAYARCLIEVAETALQQERIPDCATGFSFLVRRNLIQRRIEAMFQPSRKKLKLGLVVSVCATLTLLLFSAAYAAKSLVQDRRICLVEAQRMADLANRESAFPIVVNELVLTELNKYLGTPDGRDFMRASLQRMEHYRGLVQAKVQEYRVPMELMAIPLVESGYQNLAETNRTGWGAGLWMFIKSTARKYGLQVDENVDQRLNVELLTDAAMRYLLSNYLLFKDWHLSALAYNMGENAVQNAIDQTGSRDAWHLVRRGFENDKNYLPKLVAAILILKNPTALN